MERIRGNVKGKENMGREGNVEEKVEVMRRGNEKEDRKK